MVLAQSEILGLVHKGKLIKGFSDKCMSGAGYDLRVGKIYRIKSGATLGVRARENPEVEEINLETFVIYPNEYVLVETHEEVNMPDYLIARILPRSTVFRSGCLLTTALVDPGYKGTLTMGLKNISNYEFKLEKLAPIAQIVFEKVEGQATLYEGVYQGGKVTAQSPQKNP